MNAFLALAAAMLVVSVVRAGPENAPTGAAPVSGSVSLRALLTVGAESEFLHPDQAFVLSLEPSGTDALVARFAIDEGYYLYRDKMHFALSGEEGAVLGSPHLPEGERKHDDYFGDTWVYYRQAEVRLPLSIRSPTNTPVGLQATYQGCAERGICYPPVTKQFTLQLGAGGALRVTAAEPRASGPNVSPPTAIRPIAADATRGSLWLLLLGAFGTGLLLSFTPCVLPMIPILSAFIVGRRGAHITRLRAGGLSAAYVLGTVLTYAVIGAVAGATGEQLQAYFQTAWAIGVLSAVLVAMALAMFGLYELQIPAFIQSRFHTGTQGMGGGSVVGAFVLGLWSALIVGACVSPLLISALGIAIANADPILGSAIMVFLALGMGVVLIGAGLGAGFLLPRAGSWMERVKHGLGVLLLAVAIYLLGVLPAVPVLLLWSVLFVGVAVYLIRSARHPKTWRYLSRVAAALLLVWGIFAAIGST